MNHERTLIGYRIIRMHKGWREWVFHTRDSEEFGPSKPSWSREVAWSTMYLPHSPKEMKAAQKLARKMKGRVVPVYLRIVPKNRTTIVVYCADYIG